MSTILQDMMGMLKRSGTVVPKPDNYITVARYPNPQERLKPAPKLQTELVTLAALKTFFASGGDKQTLSIAGQVLSLTNGGSVTLPDEYINAGVFDGATDKITLTRVSGGTVVIDMNRKDVSEYVNHTDIQASVGKPVAIPEAVAGQLIIVENIGGPGQSTLRLPGADGEAMKFRKLTIATDGTTDVNTNLILEANGADTINGAGTMLLDKVYASVSIWSNGSNWTVLSSSQVTAV
tara:strand:+ start:82 stop:789 length:708 start_codon:yes stop_codon:yes gene_type:complete